MAMRIYTRTGDRGETGLHGGRRVSKASQRVAAYGTVDELNAALGCAVRAVDDKLTGLLTYVQGLLFVLGADLASPTDSPNRLVGLTEADVETIERSIDAAEKELPPLTSFILPTGGEAATRLHLARAVCRRAEREVVALLREEPETAEINLIFLNRLSDLLFVWARLANRRDGGQEVEWSARG